MQPSPEHRTAGLSRRSVLASGAVAVLAAGCDLGSGPEDAGSTRTARTLSPDVAVAVEATTLINQMIAAVGATTAAFPGLGPVVAGLAAMHTAHLAAVQDAVPDRVDTSAGGTGYVVPTGRDAARAQLVVAERAHHDQLVGLAMRAEAGLFAGLLGRMAASVSQHLAVLA